MNLLTVYVHPCNPKDMNNNEALNTTTAAKRQVREALAAAGITGANVTAGAKFVKIMHSDREAVLAAIPNSFPCDYNPRVAYLNR